MTLKELISPSGSWSESFGTCSNACLCPSSGTPRPPQHHHLTALPPPPLLDVHQPRHLLTACGYETSLLQIPGQVHAAAVLQPGLEPFWPSAAPSYPFSSGLTRLQIIEQFHSFGLPQAVTFAPLRVGRPCFS